MNTSTKVISTLLIAVAAMLATAVQLIGIDNLATERTVARQAQVVQLPGVVVTSQRDSALAAVQQLPAVLIVGRRAVNTAQTDAPRPTI